MLCGSAIGADGRVAVRRGVGSERTNTGRRVQAARRIGKKHEIPADGRVVLAGRVVRQRTSADGCVDGSGDIVKKRLIAGGSVKTSFCIGKKGKRSIGRVLDAGRVA